MSVLAESLWTTLICFTIVFLVLILLIYIMKFQHYIIEKINSIGAKKKPSQATAVETAQTTYNAEEDEELVAVITAAIAAMLGRPASSLVVRSIKMVETANPSWADAGRREQIDSRF